MAEFGKDTRFCCMKRSKCCNRAGGFSSLKVIDSFHTAVRTDLDQEIETSTMFFS